MKAFLANVTLFEVTVVWSMGLITYAVVKQHDVAMVTALLGNLAATLYGRIKGQTS